MAKCITPVYAGKRSTAFWDAIRNLPEDRRYSLYRRGVELQNLEAMVLKELKDALGSQP